MIGSLVALLGVLVAAVVAGSYALVTERQRRTVLSRASGIAESILVLQPERPRLAETLARELARRVPQRWAAQGSIRATLVHAGFDSPSAPLVFTTLRVVLAAVPTLLVVSLMPRTDSRYFASAVALTLLVGVLAPTAFVQNRARSRQERLQRQLPDCLDLLVVCVEAGVSLDAALIRVAREMANVHPDLSSELGQVTRRVNAGMPRDRALHAMYDRTGVLELRSLVATMIQSEKWGTSIATVLRVYAEGLRRRRKQLAEKKAATAPLKMMLPLGVFVFPVIFIVLIGPAILRMTEMFKTTGS